MTLLDDLSYSYIGGQILGVLLLMISTGSSNLHPGNMRDCPNFRDGYVIPFHYTVYFYIKVPNLS